MRNLHLDIDSDTHAPRVVRHTLRAWLEPVACSADIKLDITILVNELVTDAVLHNATRIRTRMIFDDGRLHIATRDNRPTATTGASHCALEHLAEQISDGWARHATDVETHTWAEILC